MVRIDSQKHIDYSLHSPFGGGRPGRVKRRNQAKGGDGGDEEVRARPRAPSCALPLLLARDELTACHAPLAGRGLARPLPRRRTSTPVAALARRSGWVAASPLHGRRQPRRVPTSPQQTRPI
eukprot:scaffold685_cov324-Prasinococcus_capsulatus_cf.AAC.4